MSFILSYKHKRGYIFVVGTYTGTEIHKRLLNPVFLAGEIAAGRARRIAEGLHIHCNADALCIGAEYSGSMRLFVMTRPPIHVVKMAEHFPLEVARSCIASYLHQYPKRKNRFHKILQKSCEGRNDLLNIIHLRLIRERLEIFPNIPTILVNP